MGKGHKPGTRLGPYKPVELGTKFGRLVVLSLLAETGSKGYKYLCRCDCGREAKPSASDLRSGNVQSCGCWRRTMQRNAATTHGHRNTNGQRSRTYNSWAHIKARCLNPNNPKYPRYGGRGIKVCERWMLFKNFLADMGEAPEGMTIDRKDNNGNYEPGNCRWADQTTQQRNRSNTRLVEFNGELMSVSALAEKVGVNYDTLHTRLFDYGYSVAEAVKPQLHRNRKSLQENQRDPR